MHEVALTESLIGIVGEYARREGFTRVNCLRLSFGRLSCLDPGALEFTFAVQARGTAAEGARLEFDIRPALIVCTTCGAESVCDGPFDALCPRCGSFDVRLVGGTEELKLLEMDVD
ncbi:MAG: hydrogenase maturation nickel metallochaperone HypA/HybF [Syntrophales bacterium]